ncbi:MAG: hypothetical protein ACJAYU_002168 [Bradymonadia bacterium]|jgi:hypothetical protein
MSLKELLLDDATPISAVAEYLDAMSHDDRLAEVRSCNRAQQVAMYNKAAASPAITFEHFVPANVAALTEVIHHGRNTLPAFKLFEKRFCRPAAGGERLFGYNEGTTRGLIGPGFFVAIPTASNPDWMERGAIVVDYFQVPDEDVVEGWPEVIPNTKGLQMFVYQKTRDFMRKVSEHVSIGAAFKVEKPMGAYFVLCREDVA